MTISQVNASFVTKRAGSHSQAVDVNDVQGVLVIGRQILASMNGEVPTDFADQAKLVWHTVFAQLAAA